MKTAEEIKKIWRDALTQASEQIIMSALTGQTLTQETVTVELSLAKPLVDALRNAAKQCDMNEQEFFTSIAANVFKEGMAPLKIAQKEKGTGVHPDLMETGSLNNPSTDMDKITNVLGDFKNKMNQMQEVLGQFQGLESLLHK